jgi:hypothetical protein
MILRTLILAGLTLPLIQGCMMPEQAPPQGRIAMALPETAVDLHALQPPEQLGAFRYQASMEADGYQLRVLRYQHVEDAGRHLEIALYPLPGGWDDLAADRVIDGHFAHVREESIGRLSRRSNTPAREIRHDNMIDATFSHPIAVTELRSARDTSALTDIVLLTVKQPLFIRLRLESAHSLSEPAPSSDQLINEAAALMRTFHNHLPSDHAGH